MAQNPLADIVNQSGFPLQIGLAEAVRLTTANHGWRVLYVEHAWRSEEQGTSGFFDLALQDRHGSSVLVIECKRVLDTDWIFLQPGTRIRDRRNAKAWVKTGDYFGWFDPQLDPVSPESAYCVVRGQNHRERPMLERVAAEIVCATEALAHEERALQFQPHDFFRMYMTAIVTTAQLRVCVFPPGEVALSDGTIDNPTFHTVPYLRFRKQLSTRVPLPNAAGAWDAQQQLVEAKEQTVFIINAEALLQFLSEYELDAESVRPLTRR